MSTVAIAAVGSRGDVAPLTGVGVALQQAGHRVVVAAYTPFADLITGCGLEFRELPADFTPGADSADVSPSQAAAAMFTPRGVRSGSPFGTSTRSQNCSNQMAEAGLKRTSTGGHSAITWRDDDRGEDHRYERSDERPLEDMAKRIRLPVQRRRHVGGASTGIGSAHAGRRHLIGGN